MQVGRAVGMLAAELKGKVELPRLEAEVLLAWATGLQREKLYAYPEKEISPLAWEQARAAARRRAEGYPLQYLTGKQEFMSLEFKVTPDVLIPRRETEVLVEAVLERVPPGRAWYACDVGTGCGAIAVSLGFYLSRSRIFAVDRSRAALDIARENARRLGVDERITFALGDLLLPFLAGDLAMPPGGLDAVVSNPPYIPVPELENLPPEVRHEPREALDGGADGLAVYRRLIPQAALVLKPGGLLALEMGSHQGQAVGELVRASGAFKDPEILPDYAGRDRCLLAYKK
ncbi:MAG: release factor glutamine methyltransferase [Clostridia bacterium]|nr:release factor glutamine methyltransferase [Clostridia bacterium]